MLTLGLELNLTEFFLEAAQVAPHARTHIGVHDGDQGALILAEFRQDFRRQRYRHFRRDFLDDGLDPLLVLRVRV